MASSSIQNRTRKPQVFISFRGDLRLNFVDHLFGAFQRKHIFAFKDNKMIKKGESLEPELIHAIKGSLVYVVVLSKNFASSTWCLRELEMILECVRVSQKHVFPVFYDVDPSEVRGQKVGSYAKAFDKHEERFKEDLDKVQRWRAALTQVADLAGWDMRSKPQYEEIEKMVKEILNILSHRSHQKDVVGMQSPIKEVENLLRLDSVDDVRVIGIIGMGGIGKSTLATILYSTISDQFDACCFIHDVSKIYRHDGSIGVLEQILHQILREEPLTICNVSDADSLIQNRLCRVRALIILDNVDQGGQLEKLAMDRKWLGPGSRMIIVSRDEHIMKEYRVDDVYKVPLLNHANSLQLFCRKAFKSDYIMRDYEQLAGILDYASGLPLAIEVLGSSLFGRDISAWRSLLARLRESPNKDIMDVLRFSFDGLEETEKEIFLDIACFFVGWRKTTVKHILDCCGFHPGIGLRVLIDKSLITSIADDEYSEHTFGMHDLLQELGKQIVRENSKPNPRKWSRLWKPEQFNKVVQENMEKNVEAIVLKHHQLCNIKGEMSIGETLSKMSHLRLLILWNVDLLGNLNCLSNELRYVDLHEYSFEYLPSSFQPNQLVELRLPSSKIKQLWEDKKYLPKLKVLDLSHSKNLLMTPDFSDFPNIEWLNLEGCERLKHLGSCNDVPRKLVFLNVNYCKKLSSIPNGIFGLSSLRDLHISGCSYAVNNLNLVSEFASMIRLPFHSLCELDVGFCNIREVPDAIGHLQMLERLNFGGNKFKTLPSLEKLSKLEYLNLEHCKYLKSLTKLPSPATISDDKYWRARGMYIFNCPRLGANNMTSTWMEEFIRANQQSSAPFQYVDTIIPVNKSQMYFKNQVLGSLRIWIDPPTFMAANGAIMAANGVIGVTYWAVFPMAPSNERRFLELKIRFLQTNYGYTCFDINSPVILDCDHIKVESTHMWLIYFPLKSFLHSLNLLGMLPMNLDRLFIDANKNSSVKVMKHGYKWVFDKDL